MSDLQSDIQKLLDYTRTGPRLPDPAAELAALRERVRVLREALGDMLDEFGCDTRYDTGETRWNAKDAIAAAKKAMTATEPTP